MVGSVLDEMYGACIGSNTCTKKLHCVNCNCNLDISILEPESLPLLSKQQRLALRLVVTLVW